MKILITGGTTFVSKYAAENSGVEEVFDGTEWHLKVNNNYGRNTEFLAEAMAEARCSKHPREIAVMVREELEKLMKERGLA